MLVIGARGGVVHARVVADAASARARCARARAGRRRSRGSAPPARYSRHAPPRSPMRLVGAPAPVMGARLADGPRRAIARAPGNGQRILAGLSGSAARSSPPGIALRRNPVRRVRPGVVHQRIGGVEIGVLQRVARAPTLISPHQRSGLTLANSRVGAFRSSAGSSSSLPCWRNSARPVEDKPRIVLQRRRQAGQHLLARRRIDDAASAALAPVAGRSAVTRAISRRAAVDSSRHRRRLSRWRSTSGVKRSPCFWMIAASSSGSKLLVDPGLRISVAAFARRGPAAIIASPRRTLPMPVCGIALAEPEQHRGRRHGVGHGLFGAGKERVAAGPVGIGFEEAVDLGEGRPAVLVEQIAPLDQLARGGVCGPGRQARGPRSSRRGRVASKRAGDRARGRRRSVRESCSACIRSLPPARAASRRIVDRRHHDDAVLLGQPRRQGMRQSGGTAGVCDDAAAAPASARAAPSITARKNDIMRQIRCRPARCRAVRKHRGAHGCHASDPALPRRSRRVILRHV